MVREVCEEKIWCINDITGKIKLGNGFDSHRFYLEGYCWRLWCEPNWGNMGQVAILFELLSGQYDDLVNWPFCGEINLEFIHPQSDHFNHKKQLRSENQRDEWVRPSQLVSRKYLIFHANLTSMEKFIAEGQLILKFQVITRVVNNESVKPSAL
jgi:hypothetical protein